MINRKHPLRFFPRWIFFNGCCSEAGGSFLVFSLLGILGRKGLTGVKSGRRNTGGTEGEIVLCMVSGAERPGPDFADVRIVFSAAS